MIVQTSSAARPRTMINLRLAHRETSTLGLRISRLVRHCLRMSDPNEAITQNVA